MSPMGATAYVNRIPHREGRKLDLGSGGKESEGADWVTFDITSAFGADVQGDGRRLPFLDGAFAEVRAHHVLEHIERRDLGAVMNECHRVLVDGGVLDIEVPVFPSDSCVNDPTHISWFGRKTFDYFVVDQTEYSGYWHLYGFLPWRYEFKQIIGKADILWARLIKVAE